MALREPEEAVAISVGDLANGTVILGALPLRFLSETVRRLKVEGSGRAYVVDSTGRLLAYRDQPVKDNTDLSSLEQVKVARASPSTREQPGKTIESDGH